MFFNFCYDFEYSMETQTQLISQLTVSKKKDISLCQRKLKTKDRSPQGSFYLGIEKRIAICVYPAQVGVASAMSRGKKRYYGFL